MNRRIGFDPIEYNKLKAESSFRAVLPFSMRMTLTPCLKFRQKRPFIPSLKAEGFLALISVNQAEPGGGCPRQVSCLIIHSTCISAQPSSAAVESWAV